MQVAASGGIGKAASSAGLSPDHEDVGLLSRMSTIIFKRLFNN
jgi:hypothetical protein